MKLTLYSFFGGMFVFVGILVAYVLGSLDRTSCRNSIFTAIAIVAFPCCFSAFCAGGIWPLHVGADWSCRCSTAGSMLLTGW
jgi:NADH:ubiquinone oxidoreductase subunit 4 (subunit M)